MIIQIDGVNTLNKGAELMMYSVLENIENYYPEAKVYYNPNNYSEPIDIETKCNLVKRSGTMYFRYINSILRKLGLKVNYFTPFRVRKDVNVLFDAGGFQFSDQWVYSDDYLNNLENYYKQLNQQGTKIFFLPQAFGPFEKAYSNKCVEILSKYSTLVFARETISYNYLIEAGFPKEKLMLSPDFTLVTKGNYPSNTYNDFVCFIPNKKMITNTKLGKVKYLDFCISILNNLQSKGEKVFLLNHEGIGDLSIINEINSKLERNIDVVTGLNAIEVKGIIGKSKLVISSRFHGVASALSQGVPCLATSWNHKYECLFKEYDFNNSVLKLDDLEESNSIVVRYLKELGQISDKLINNREIVKSKIIVMWEEVNKLIRN